MIKYEFIGYRSLRRVVYRLTSRIGKIEFDKMVYESDDGKVNPNAQWQPVRLGDDDAMRDLFFEVTRP